MVFIYVDARINLATYQLLDALMFQTQPMLHSCLVFCFDGGPDNGILAKMVCDVRRP